MSDYEVLIVEARTLDDGWVERNGKVIHADELARELAAALEAVTAERDNLAAVIEKAKAWMSDNARMQTELDRILASAPGDALREHDAKVLEDAASDPTMRLRGHSGVSIKGLRRRAAALRVGANPKENER